MTSDIGGITVDKITFSCFSKRNSIVLTSEAPIEQFNGGSEAFDLIDDFRDISGAEPLRLVSERHIEFAPFVESNDAIETRTVQEKEVQRIACCVKTVAHTVVVAFPLIQ